MRFQWLVGLVLVVALGVVAATYIAKRGEKSKANADDVIETSAEKTSEKEAVLEDILKEPVLRADKNLPSTTTTTTTGTRSTDRPVLAQTATPPRLPVGEQWRNQTLPRGVTETVPAAKRFAKESRDDGWAQATEERLKQRVMDMATGGISFEKVECRTSMCRLDVEGAADVVVDFVDKMIDDSATRSDVGSVTLGGNSSDAAMFLSYKR